MTLEKQELDRIEAAKTAIGTAIAGKGVAVPSGTKLDGMAALIEGIEQGGGGEDVSAETAEYTELLTDLETTIDALPDAGSGGGSGGSVETCTVNVSRDEEYSVLGVRMDGSLPVPYFSDGSTSYLTWNAPCGSIVAVSSFFSIAYSCTNATCLGDDNGTYIIDGTMTQKEIIYLFRIDAQPGETASIDIVEG